MDKFEIPEGAHGPSFWRSWGAVIKWQLEKYLPWTLNRERWEAIGGAVAQPINFPHYEDELIIFPRNIAMRLFLELSRDPRWRNRIYKDRLQNLSANKKRPGRGAHTFLILPSTYDRIDQQLGTRPGSNTKEIRRVLRELYFKGKRHEEVASKVSGKTLLRALSEAEETLDILREFRIGLRISLKTLEISYTAMRLGRDGQIDIRRYFYPRIF